MRIGVDIDGVLNDFEKFMDDIAITHNYSVVNAYGNNFDSRFGISLDEANLLWDKVRYDYLINYPPRVNCKEVISNLIIDNEIILVSNRGYGINSNVTSEYIFELTKKWLEINQIKYTSLFFIEGSKKPLIMKEKIDIFIDDSANVVNDLKGILPVICVSASYNKHLGADTIRANNWNEVNQIINTYYKAK